MEFPDKPDLNEERERPAERREETAEIVRQEEGDVITREQAESYLGVKPSEFDTLVKRFGIGRYNQPEPGEQWVYAREDIERLKESLSSAA
jgi:hypothetical protein